MKKLTYLVTFFFVLAASPLWAQLTALDFTKTDCDGTEHQFFSELDAGNVIMLEFAMNCQSCVNARTVLEAVEADFANSHPGRFHIYTMSYSNTTSCDNMKKWPVVKNFSNPAFIGVADQLSHYGGFGMPTIVIAAGKDHKVLYSRVGFPYVDSLIEKELVKINGVINEGLTLADVATPNVSDEPLVVYPNPARESISIAGDLPLDEIVVLNSLGQEVLRKTALSVADQKFDISPLLPGLYAVRLRTAGGGEKSSFFIKE